MDAVKDFLKVSIDSGNGLVWVKGMVGPTSAATYTLQITGYLPSG